MFKIKEDYLVEVQSIRKMDDNEDKITLQTTGGFTYVNDKYYITYKEYDNNDPEKYKLCIVKMEPDFVTIIKNDTYQTKLILEKGKRHYCPYYTEFGMLMTGIFTHDINYNFTKSQGEVNFKYQLDINSMFAGSNDVTIKLKKMKNK